MTDFNSVAAGLSPDLYQRFKSAVELGKWPDGRTVTHAQKLLCLEAMLAYEQMHLPAEEHTGYMPAQHCASKSEPITLIHSTKATKH